MVINPPPSTSDELPTPMAAPVLDPKSARQDFSPAEPPALIASAPLEPGFLLKRTTRNRWFFVLLLTSFLMHAGLMLAASLWNKQSETPYGEEPIPVELIIEAANQSTEPANTDPQTEPVMDPPMNLAATEPLPAEPVAQTTLLQPDAPVPPLEQTIAPEEQTPHAVAPEPEPAPAPVQPQAAPQPQAAKPAPTHKPAAAPSQPRPAAISESRLADFRANLTRKLWSAFRYPALARERSTTGTVTVTFELDPDGNVTKVSVVQSSGHDELDADALATIRRAAPFEPPPQGAPRIYTFPIIYRLR